MTIADDDEKVHDREESADFKVALSRLEERCKKAEMVFTTQQEPQNSLFEPAENPVSVQFPCGREKRPVTLWGLAALRQLLDTEFEKYVFLSDYEAICSYRDGSIECIVRPLDRMPMFMLWRRIIGERKSDVEESENELTLLIQSEERPGLSLSLGQPSKEAQILCRGRRSRAGLSFRVSGATLSRHDQAVGHLETLANAFFFQLEMSYGILLSLERERTPMLRRRSRLYGQKPADLQFPKQEYDDAPISLYWYGCSAIGMPLLQFLAFYQVLEYYFPLYSQVEAKRKIAIILKNPLFRPDKDSDIGQLLSAITSKGAGIGDERSQLRATLHECIDPGQLRKFLTNDEQIAEFFQKKKTLTALKLPIANPTVDLRNDVADRIYDIRCKIVHTKGDSVAADGELLLPFSKEAGELYYDIDLLRFLARQVLVAASSPLRLP